MLLWQRLGERHRASGEHWLPHEMPRQLVAIVRRFRRNQRLLRIVPASDADESMQRSLSTVAASAWTVAASARRGAAVPRLHRAWCGVKMAILRRDKERR